MIDVSKLDITSRDFLSIYSDLKNEIPNLSQDWNSSDESDPGIVILKEIAMLGDMLSYNHDRAVLESFPATVKERKNAAQIFGMLGYKMHWYQSARCNVTITNNGPESVYIPCFTTFVTSDRNLTYTYVGNTTSIASGADSHITIEAIQGYPKTPSLLTTSVIPTNPNNPWYSVYDFNVVRSDIINNKIYISDKQIDESSIILIDSDNQEWTQVKRLDTQLTSGKYFELRIDNNDMPYLELPSYWENFDSVSKFKLFYVVTNGLDGQIKANTLTSISSNIPTTSNTVADKSTLSVSNTASTVGYNYETPAEARDNIANYVNTYDTLITLSDFQKAIRRIDGVANCIVTDKTNDPTGEVDDNGTLRPMVSTDLKAYVTRIYNPDIPDADFTDIITNSVMGNKLLMYDLFVDYQNITSIPWTIKATIYLTQKVSKSAAQNLLVQIKTAIAQTYAIQNIDYNTPVNMLDLLNIIKGVSDLVNVIDVDRIYYYSDNTRTTEVSLTDVSGKYVITQSITGSQDNPGDPIDYSFTVTDGQQIKPGTFTIQFEGLLLSDDKAGSLVCDNANFINGTVDYATGDVTFSITPSYNPTYYTTARDSIIRWTKNVITLVEYDFRMGDILIADESVEL